MKPPQAITPFLWFATQAEEAVNFYTSIFKTAKVNIKTLYDEAGAQASGMQKGSVMTIAFALEGQDFVALNGGPAFTFSPAVSFFVSCTTTQEVELLWEKFSDGATIRMPLDAYPWSEKYGWLQDKYGINWQIMFGSATQKITPCLLFVGEHFGNAEKAISFYTSVFKTSRVLMMEKYGAKEDHAGAVKHARFALEGTEFVAMDGPGKHAFTFTPAISFVVNCTAQEQIDHYWEELSKEGKKGQCGWLDDKFGITWQIVPTILPTLLSNKKKSQHVMKALLQMTKLDIKKLEDAG